MKKAAMLLIIIYFNDNEHSRGSQSSQHQSLEAQIYHQIHLAHFANIILE